jgi:hypothetical protein
MGRAANRHAIGENMRKKSELELKLILDKVYVSRKFGEIHRKMADLNVRLPLVSYDAPISLIMWYVLESVK